MWECRAARKMSAKRLLEDAATALTLGKSCIAETLCKEELALLDKRQSASARHDGTKSDQDGKSGRLVGAVQQ